MYPHVVFVDDIRYIDINIIYTIINSVYIYIHIIIYIIDIVIYYMYLLTVSNEYREISTT